MPTLASAVRVGVVCGALVLGLRLWLKWGGPFPGDGWFARLQGQTWRQPAAVQDFNLFFQVIGTPAVATATVVAILPFVARAAGLRGVMFVLVACAGVAVNAGLKELSGPTPLMTQLNATGLNYPSGHTVYAVVLCGALAVLARRSGRRDVAWPLLALIPLMGFFRVTAATHFVSDVVAAFLVGGAWLNLAAALTLEPARRGR
ncbi:MAG: phosphatase PAP2 family protein [Patulibacter sp.]